MRPAGSSEGVARSWPVHLPRLGERRVLRVGVHRGDGGVVLQIDRERCSNDALRGGTLSIERSRLDVQNTPSNKHLPCISI